MVGLKEQVLLQEQSRAREAFLRRLAARAVWQRIATSCSRTVSCGGSGVLQGMGGVGQVKER